MRIQPLFITVDPKRDTPAVLRSYVANFSAWLIGLTGTPDQLRIVQHEYPVSTVVDQGSVPVADNTIDHSSVLLLIGPHGAFLAPTRADLSGPLMTAELSRYLS